MQDLYRDARQFWAKTLPRHKRKTILIVSHSGTIHALLSTALGIPPACHHSLQQSNCGLSELTFSESLPSNPLSSGHQVQLHQLNQTAAIGEMLPKLKVNKQGVRLLLVSDDSMMGQGGDRLKERLRTAPIDFCLSAGKEQTWLKTFVEQSPQILYLSAQKANFLQSWQQHLEQSCQSSSSYATGKLMTGLVIAPRSSIQQLIMQTLGENPEAGALVVLKQVVLKQGHFSVVHYPYNHRPVVQAVNA